MMTHSDMVMELEKVWHDIEIGEFKGYIEEFELKSVVEYFLQHIRGQRIRPFQWCCSFTEEWLGDDVMDGLIYYGVLVRRRTPEDPDCYATEEEGEKAP